MKRSLYAKILTAYILIGILSFFLVTLGGSYLVEKHLEHTLSEALYSEAAHIAANDTVKYNISNSNLDRIRETLSPMAVFHNTDIWIINNKGEIILDTRLESSPSTPIKGFDLTEWGENYYQVGNFYGHFTSNRLSVIVPITADLVTKGYVAIHYQMKTLYQSRNDILLIILTIFLSVYAIIFGLLLFYRNSIHHPLHKILQGTSEFANGNLTYRIQINTGDEMEYLSNTLNYMADKLNQTGKYQRNFISNISHDFRSPLTSIKGYVEAMLDGTIPPELQEKYLKIIAFETERLEKLTRSLLTLNDLDIKKRLMHMRSFDINDTIKTTANTFEGTCRSRQIRLELLLQGRELFVHADFEQIQQVLYNLLDNAIKFSPDHSTIVLETTETNGKVFVSVKDQGCGIPKESLSRIWDRFYKTDASRGKDRKGTGLGLSIVKEIINAHDQNLNVISTPGVGTEFIFTLEKAKS